MTRFKARVIAFACWPSPSRSSGGKWSDVPLVGVNAFVVALAATGAYEVSFAKMEK